LTKKINAPIIEERENNDRERIIMNSSEKGKERRYEIYCEMIDQLDEGTRLINEYDALPHDYGAAVMYQAESQIIHLVGRNPGITASEIAVILKKTPSACSQLIRKMRKKEWIGQVRNEENNREYQLFLTESGKTIFEDHNRFEERCYRRSFENLSEFSDEELRTYIAIQKKLNETFAMDVEESKGINPVV